MRRGHIMTMNWKLGLKRLWIVATVAWLVGLGFAMEPGKALGTYWTLRDFEAEAALVAKPPPSAQNKADEGNLLVNLNQLLKTLQDASKDALENTAALSDQELKAKLQDKGALQYPRRAQEAARRLALAKGQLASFGGLAVLGPVVFLVAGAALLWVARGLLAAS